MLTTLIFLIVFQVNFYKQDCISDQALKVIGYETSYGKQIKIQNPFLCKQFYKDYGACVDMNDTKTIIQKNQEDLKLKFSIEKQLIKVLEKLQDLVKKDEQKFQQIEQIKQSIDTTSTDCFQALDQINQGVICLLTSAKASMYTSLDINQIKVKVDIQSTGKRLDKCMNWYDALCLITAGLSITQDIKLSNDVFMKNFEIFGAACENLKLQYKCTDCSQKYKALIEGMQPLINQLFPNKDQLDALEDNVESLKETTLQWISGLLTKSANFSKNDKDDIQQQTQVLLIADEDGENILQTQLDQGIPYIQLSKVYIYETVVILFLLFNNQFYGGKS